MTDVPFSTHIADTDIAGWFEMTCERLSPDGCLRERWIFQSDYSAFLIVKLMRYSEDVRPSRRHRTWTLTAEWPRRATPPPPLPRGMVDQVVAAARARVVVLIPDAT